MQIEIFSAVVESDQSLLVVESDQSLLVVESDQSLLNLLLGVLSNAQCFVESSVRTEKSRYCS